MNRYLLIQASDAHECRSDHLRALATGLAGKHHVTLFLVQNGVQAARSAASPLRELVKAGVHVRADEFSLRERGIGVDRLAPGITAAPLDLVIDELAAGAKALWF